jgi:hypothetical protein
MTRTSLLVFPLILLFSMASNTSGHGIPLSVDATGQGQLFAPALLTYDPHESQILPFPADAPSILRGTAGFYPVFGGGIPAGTALVVDAAGSPQHAQAALFWNGGAVLPSPVTIGLTRTGVNFQVGPSDTFVAGGALSAYNGQPGGHSSLTLTLPLDAPIGLYALGFQVSAPGFERSQTFWGVANNGVSDDAAARGLAVIARAVPEPSGLALAGVGLVALVWGARLRRR